MLDQYEIRIKETDAAGDLSQNGIAVALDLIADEIKKSQWSAPYKKRAVALIADATRRRDSHWSKCEHPDHLAGMDELAKKGLLKTQ